MTTTPARDLTLFIGDKNLSSWSLRPWLALTLARLPFREEVVHLDRPETKARIAAISPSAKVPVLRHARDGSAERVLVWESLAICEYVAELAPEARLWPEDRAARAVARAVATEMHAGFATLRREMPMRLVARTPNDSPEANPGASSAPGGPRAQPAWCSGGGGRAGVIKTPSPECAADVARIAEIVRTCRERFGRPAGGDFLFGAPTIADCMYAPVQTRFRTYGVELGDPIVAAYRDAVLAHPAMRAWEEGASLEVASR